MLKELAFSGALLVAFTGAHAQSSQNFGVTGQVTPGACIVTLASGGVVNVGSVSQGTAKLYPIGGVNANIVYGFPVRSVPINIACVMATKVAVSFVDNKSAQRIAFNVDDAARYGVADGAAGVAAIGFYSVQFINTTIDNVAVGQFLDAAAGSVTFSTTGPTAYPTSFATPGRKNAFAKAVGATVPDAFTTLAGTLEVQTFVSKSYIDAATTVVTPIGSGTLTLVYV